MSCTGVPAVASFEYAAWYPAACSSSLFLEIDIRSHVPVQTSAANAFDSLNSPASWPSNGDQPVAQSLCERSTQHKGGVDLTMFLGWALLGGARFV